MTNGQAQDILYAYLARLTTLSSDQQRAIVDEIPIVTYAKGTVLIRQGEIPTMCYFILKGCVRQYTVDEEGRELTANFYTEEQTIAIFNQHKSDPSSEHTFVCTEDCVAVYGELSREQDMYNKHAQLETMTRRMIEANFQSVQEEYAAFIAASPEARFKSLLKRRPSLIDRVPQHQLASFLGMTPESLSRIKKRLASGAMGASPEQQP